MFQAEHRKIAQETNVELVQLRRREIDYYVSVNVTIGTQSTLIAGFIYGLFTTNRPDQHSWTKQCQSAFYISSCIAIFFAVHIIITTMILQVFGPYLALNGPSGSMAKAAETMLQEQEGILFAFICMLIFFGITTIICFWTAAGFRTSVAITLVFLFFVRQWVYYGLRIHNRLRWDKSRALNMFEDVVRNEDEPGAFDNRQSMGQMEVDQSRENSVSSDGASSTTGIAEEPTRSNNSKRSSFDVTSLFRRSRVFDHLQYAPRPSEQQHGVVNPVQRATLMEGLLTRQGTGQQLYYALSNAAILSAYLSRDEFRDGRGSSLKVRPIDLRDYTIAFEATLPPASAADDTNTDNGAPTVVSTSSRASSMVRRMSSTPRPKFEIKFTSAEEEDEDGIRRQFLFCCEDEAQWTMWKNAMTTVSPKSVK